MALAARRWRVRCSSARAALIISTVFWRTRALADISEIVRYIATDNPVAAKRIGRELLMAGDSLVTFPRRGRPGHQPGTRELVALPPYVIVYRVADSDAVTIIRVWHAAQERPASY